MADPEGRETTACATCKAVKRDPRLRCGDHPFAGREATACRRCTLPLDGLRICAAAEPDCPSGLPPRQGGDMTKRATGPYVSGTEVIGGDLPTGACLRCDGSGTTPVYMREGDRKLDSPEWWTIDAPGETHPVLVARWSDADQHEATTDGYHFLTCLCLGDAR